MSQWLPFKIEKQSSLHFDGKYIHPENLVDQPNPMMPLLDAVCTRRTARSYSSQKVDMATFQWLIEHSTFAPSACNEQLWKVVYIDDQALIHDLYERGSASFLKKVRQCFLVCYSNQSDNKEWQDHIQSGAAFISTFQLLAHSIGIGSCWIGHLPNKTEIKRLLNIPSTFDPIALVSFGYYHSPTKNPPRKYSAAQIIMSNSFDPQLETLHSRRGNIFRKVARKCYYELPPRVRQKLKRLTNRFEKKFYHEKID